MFHNIYPVYPVYLRKEFELDCFISLSQLAPVINEQIPYARRSDKLISFYIFLRCLLSITYIHIFDAIRFRFCYNIFITLQAKLISLETVCCFFELWNRYVQDFNSFIEYVFEQRWWIMKVLDGVCKVGDFYNNYIYLWTHLQYICIAK